MAEAAHGQLGDGVSVGDARRRLQRLLDASGVEDAGREARRLIEIATGLSAEAVLCEEARSLAAGAARRLEDALARRLRGEPLSRIAGERHFYGRPFRVTPAVLDPRPETETLIDAVREIAMGRLWPDGGPSLLDIGTGSGCIIVTLALELAGARGVGVDISADALAVARANAERLGAGDRIDFRQGRGLDGIAEHFDIVVSNPPYVPTGDLAGLEAAVREFDPPQALDGGPDGLAVYRAIAEAVGSRVRPSAIVLEVGAGQAEQVVQIFRETLRDAVRSVFVHADLGAVPRCVAMQTQF